MQLPKMYRVRQRLSGTRIENIAETVADELQGLSLSAVQPGHRIAITAGSRGIAEIARILQAVVDFFKSIGAEPFLFPAMGSHGGATAAGQVAVLQKLGITESSVNAPIRSSMEVAQIGATEDDVPVYIDKIALSADHILVVNRIKSHTKFKAPIESGLMKMMAIGMGKQEGAKFYHRAAVQYTFPKIILDAGRIVINKAPIVGAVGIVENGYGETTAIAAMKPDDIENREKELLLLSKRMMARLPFDDIDLLIVDEIGKDISGVGIDPNITGRNRDFLDVFEHPARVKRIFVRDLTDQTRGNAIGIGLADITTKRLVDKIDYAATYKNCITAISLEKAAVPMHFETDREAIDVALGSLGLIAPVKSRIVRIKNTLQLETVAASESYANDLDQRPDLEILEEPSPMAFDEQNNLYPLF